MQRLRLAAAQGPGPGGARRAPAADPLTGLRDSRSAPGELDADSFRRPSSPGPGRRRQAETTTGAAATLRTALALWRGPALADITDAAFARQRGRPPRGGPAGGAGGAHRSRPGLRTPRRGDRRTRRPHPGPPPAGTALGPADDRPLPRRPPSGSAAGLPGGSGPYPRRRPWDRAVSRAWPRSRRQSSARTRRSTGFPRPAPAPARPSADFQEQLRQMPFTGRDAEFARLAGPAGRRRRRAGAGW